VPRPFAPGLNCCTNAQIQTRKLWETAVANERTRP
jgi:hypothetical protein